MTDVDQNGRSIERVSVPVTSLIEAVRFIDAFGELFRPERANLAGYNSAIGELRPEVFDGVNGRIAMQGGGTNAAMDAEHLFMHEATMWAIELCGEFRDLLHDVGHDVYKD